MHPFPNPMNTGGRSRFTTWNPSDKAAGVTLSNGNLTASPTNNPAGVRGTNSRSSGKYCLGFTLSGGNNLYVGVANASQSLTAAGNTGSNSITVGGPTTNNINLGSTSIGALTGTPGSSDTIYFVVDLTNKLVWVRINNGAWSGAVAGVGDPIAGTGGASFAAISGGVVLFPFYDANTSSVVSATLNAAPSIGIADWDQ